MHTSDTSSNVATSWLNVAHRSLPLSMRTHKCVAIIAATHGVLGLSDAVALFMFVAALLAHSGSLLTHSPAPGGSAALGAHERMFDFLLDAASAQASGEAVGEQRAGCVRASDAQAPAVVRAEEGVPRDIAANVVVVGPRMEARGPRRQRVKHDLVNSS